MDTHINIRNILGVVLLALVPSGVQAQVRVEVVKDTKTTEMIVANTAAAMGNETLHSAQTDSIRRRSLDIMSSMLFRQYMNDMDMQQRKDLAPYRQESRLYRKLVLECQRFVTQAAMLCEVVKDNPVNTAYCYQQLGELSMLAKQEVKNAVVFGMDGQVPNPFKVNYADLIEGKVTVPVYRQDADRDTVVFKSYNLLLPDERMTIINSAISNLRDYTRALRRVTYKIPYHTGFRKALRQTSPYAYRMLVTTERAVGNVVGDIERAGGLFK